LIHLQLRADEEEGNPLTLASLSQHFVPLAACLGLCVLIACAGYVRWQDLPWDHRWIGPEDEIVEVEVTGGNAFAGIWDSSRIQFHCKALTEVQCARVLAFRDFVARHDFRGAETPPSKYPLMDQGSTTLSVRLKSGDVVEKYIYDHTDNANFNNIIRAQYALDQDDLTERVHRFVQ
jgi:hypothetical protein